MGRANEHNPDPISGVALATGALLGLVARVRFGMGQHILTTMLCANLYANSLDAISYEGKPPRPMADPDVLGLDALYRLYQTRQGWVFLACPQESEWRDLCVALGRPELLQDARFVDAAARKVNDAALAEILRVAFRQRTAVEWEQFLLDRDIACVQADHARWGEYMNVDPVMQEIGMMVEVEHPTFGKHLRYGNTVQLSETPGRLGPGCEVGQHTRAILEELGYGADAIADLKARKIVAIWEPGTVAVAG